MTSNRGGNGEKRRRSDGAKTHAAILEAAMELASVEGVHGLTIGRLAEALGVSKSGIHAHFGSREQLQLETIEAAESVLMAEVVEPALGAPDGMARLEKMLEAYFSYVERWVFPGGCFFASLLAEEDAREGPVHEVVQRMEKEWQQHMAGLVRSGQSRGEVLAVVDADQVAWELYACMEMTNYHFVLFRDPVFLSRGRRAVADALDRIRAG